MEIQNKFQVNVIIGKGMEIQIKFRRNKIAKMEKKIHSNHMKIHGNSNLISWRKIS